MLQIQEGSSAVVVVIKEIPEGAEISGETVTNTERKDLNRARAYLADVVTRNGLPVFSEVGTATMHAVELWRDIMEQRQTNAVADV